MATIATLSAVSTPAAFAGRVLSSDSSRPRLASSFNGRQLALPGVQKASARRQAAGPRAFLGGPGCGPRFGGQGFYGRRAGYPCGPQGVVVVQVPGLGTWTDSSPPDPEQFEEYQKRQKEAYEQRRAAYEQRRAAAAAEAEKRRELREKQAAFFRRQQEELAAEREKWRNDYWNRGQAAQSQATADKTTETPTQEPAAESAKQDAAPQKESEAPPKYPRSDTPVLHLRNEATGAELTVVGTAHSSEASVDAVRRTIREEQPGAVLVQLDRKRYNRLTAASPEQAFFEDMLRAFVGPVGTGVVGAGFLGFYGMLAYRGMAIGRELEVAIQEARRAGAKIILGDRATDETMRRVEAAMSPGAVQAFFAQPLPRDILDDLAREMGPGLLGPWGLLAGGPAAMTWGDALRDRRVVRKLNAYMARAAPELYKVLVEERTAALVRALRHCEGKTVAVVDMSHLDGIEQAWQQLNEATRTDRQAEVAAAEGANAPADAPKAEEKVDVVDVDVIDAVSSDEAAPVADADVIDGVTGEEEAVEGPASASDADVIDGVTGEEGQADASGTVASAEVPAPSARAEGAEERSEGTADESSSDAASAEERSDVGGERGPEEPQES